MSSSMCNGLAGAVSGAVAAAGIQVRGEERAVRKSGSVIVRHRGRRTRFLGQLHSAYFPRAGLQLKTGGVSYLPRRWKISIKATSEEGSTDDDTGKAEDKESLSASDTSHTSSESATTDSSPEEPNLAAEEEKVTVGSPLPGVNPSSQAARLPKAVVDILRDQVFGFDTFFVTGQEPYEGGILFNGNLRGDAAKACAKLTQRLKDKFGDEYKLFLLSNPTDDRPVAVIVPSDSLEPRPAGSG